jgi:hypothetical protein
VSDDADPAPLVKHSLQWKGHAFAEKRKRIRDVALARSIFADQKRWIGKAHRFGWHAPEPLQDQTPNAYWITGHFKNPSV